MSTNNLEYIKQWQIKNRDKLSKYSRKWALKNKDKLNKSRKLYRLKNREKCLYYNKLYRAKNRDKFLEYDRTRYARDREKIVLRNRKKELFKRYNLTWEQYGTMLESQNNKCAICGNVLKLGKATVVDHNHETGKVRQILCSNCNLSLGGFKESIETLNKAIDYLKRWEIL